MSLSEFLPSLQGIPQRRNQLREHPATCPRRGWLAPANRQRTAGRPLPGPQDRGGGEQTARL